ncbi:MAG: hypothetical protein ACRD3Q_04440 [Terriglobales bacterium]
MSFECRVSEITDHERGVLDLARLFELSESGRSGSERPRGQAALATRSADPFSVLPTLEKDAMVLQGRMPLLKERRRAAIVVLAPLFFSLEARKQRRTTKLPVGHEVALGTVEGTGSELSRKFVLRETGTKTIRLPHFLDRHISAGVLKQMAGRPDDVLLRQDGSEWHIVRDNDIIDLADRSVMFRLGPVEMYS